MKKGRKTEEIKKGNLQRKCEWNREEEGKTGGRE
jgi:hypothetical protein